MDPKKSQIVTSTKELLLPISVSEISPGAQRQQRRQRLHKAFLHGAGFLILFLGFKVLTRSTGQVADLSAHEHKGHHKHPHHQLSTKQREKLYLSIPSTDSALAASRAYATHPHIAGSAEDFSDAKVILELFQNEFNIPTPSNTPIYSAGTPESRNATLSLTRTDAPTIPTAWMDIYYPVLNLPLDRSLSILGSDGKNLWTADLVEDGDPRDPDAHQYKEAVPAFHGLSCDGDVTGQLVYANYGLKEDFDELVARGVNFTNKIVITRYGSIFRGLKIKGAQELGASGVLIYSDPRDDGFVTVGNGYAPYPAGPARNPTSVQRGSVQYLSLYPGDPTTPGYPAYEDAQREEGSNIPKIPSLPISWQNAERLLEEIGAIYLEETDNNGKRRLSGKTSETNIRLVNHVDTKVTPIWNTMASIPGHIKDEVVIIGCHRDAWVLGAADPTSGTVSLHEIIRGYGALLKKGWKPLRTVIFASWDAEEYGLVGSTEWGEDFSSWISDHVVSYLNVDVSVSGSRWVASGSPSLAPLIKRTALDVPHPSVPGKSLWDARQDEGPFKGTNQNLSVFTPDAEYMESYKEEIKQRDALNSGISPLGSGSDFTVFLQRLGVASSDTGFGFTPSDAVYHYHSIYDSQHWQETYGDPDFSRHVAVANQLGLLGLRLIDSIVVPLNTTQYSLELDDYLDKVEDLLPELSLSGDAADFSALRNTIKELQIASSKLDDEKFQAEKDFKKVLKKIRSRKHGKCLRRSGTLRRLADWIKSVFGVSPPTDQELEQLSTREINVWEYLTHDVSLDEIHAQDNGGHGHRLPLPIRRLIKAAKRVSTVNKKLIAFERGFISEGGIKDREWYKHLGVAPGKWLGYGATTFPALTEALSIDKSATLAQKEADRLVELLDKLAKNIKV